MARFRELRGRFVCNTDAAILNKARHEIRLKAIEEPQIIEERRLAIADLAVSGGEI